MENLLSITRIGAGEDARVTKTPEAAEEVIEGAVGKFRRQYPQIDVRVELPEEFFLVPMDPLLIQQVMTNLLENAAVHGVTTTRVVVSLEKRGKWARFTAVSYTHLVFLTPKYGTIMTLQARGGEKQP